jgi:uncharacterized protein YndB with AHSA1/START domain
MSAPPEFSSARVERVLPAAPERVYDAWLDERSLRAFMCPAPGQAEEVLVEPQVGGRLRVVMTFPDPRNEINGEFLALDRPERVSFTWRTQDGQPASIVTVLFAPHGEEQTLMTIIHTRQPAELVVSYQAGWSSIAERLEEYLATA